MRKPSTASRPIRWPLELSRYLTRLRPASMNECCSSSASVSTFVMLTPLPAPHQLLLGVDARLLLVQRLVLRRRLPDRRDADAQILQPRPELLGRRHRHDLIAEELEGVLHEVHLPARRLGALAQVLP